MGRPRTTTVDAVILRHSNFGEADRLVVFYARGQGKMRALAKGVRRIRSRKAGHVEPLTVARLLLAQGRDLAIVVQADTLHTFPRLRHDLQRYACGAYVAELADKFAFEGEAHPGLYRLLRDTLQRLGHFTDTDLVLRYYELHLLDITGFRPELHHCTLCGAVVQPEAQYFSPQHGGVVCPRCGETHPARPISVDALRYLRHFQRSNFALAARARPPQPIHQEMEALMQAYLVYVLERRLNTPAFLQHLRRLTDDTPPASA